MARRTRAMATALAALAVVVLGSPAFPATRAPDAPDPVAPASTSTKSSAISTLPYPAGSGARTMVSNGQGNHVEATSGPGAIDVSDAGSGFTVIAARGGVVRAARDDSQVGCGDLSCWAEANYVLIDHGDGTSGLYLHLAPSGVVVREGEVVTRGQELAAAGSTGFTTGTHLHFQVQQTHVRPSSAGGGRGGGGAERSRSPSTMRTPPRRRPAPRTTTALVPDRTSSPSPRPSPTGTGGTGVTP